MERFRRASQLRRVLAQAGSRPLPWSDKGSHAQRRRLVGSGRFLRTPQGLRGIRAERPRAAKCPGRRPLEPRRLVQRRGRPSGSRRIRVGDRKPLPPRDPSSLVRRSSQGPELPVVSRSHDVSHRHECLAVVRSLAAPPECPSANLCPQEWPAGVRAAARRRK